MHAKRAVLLVVVVQTVVVMIMVMVVGVVMVVTVFLQWTGIATAPTLIVHLHGAKVRGDRRSTATTGHRCSNEGRRGCEGRRREVVEWGVRQGVAQRVDGVDVGAGGGKEGRRRGIGVGEGTRRGRVQGVMVVVMRRQVDVERIEREIRLGLGDGA